jgi:2'-5' RNA ligase
VLWLDVRAAEEGEDGLGAVVGETERRLAEAGFGREERTWVSHLTLGRAREGRSLPDLTDAARGLTLPEGLTSIAEIALVRSELGPTGPVYTVLERSAAIGDRSSA